MKRNNFAVFCLLFTLFSVAALAGKSLNYSEKEVKGVKVITNKNMPADPSFKVAMKEVFCLQGDLEDSVEEGGGRVAVPNSFQIDSKGNIFVFSTRSGSIKKYDSRGKFIVSFGGKGSGPGEYRSGLNHIVIDDKIVVPDQVARKLVVFNNDGQFSKNVDLSAKFPADLVKVGSGKFLGMSNYQEQKDGSLYLGFSLNLLDKGYQEIKRLWDVNMKFDPSKMAEISELLASQPEYVIGRERIYLGLKDTDSYTIEAYDFDGNLVGKIKRKYRRIRMTKEEIANAPTKGKVKVSSSDGSLDSETELKERNKYKNSISKLLVDKRERLWVESARDAKKTDCSYTYYDIFSSEGVFLNTIKLDKDYRQLKFINEKLYLFTGENNDLKVFDY